jgi:pSer/pThr/pTyr-binding forkhead associated (FHA) protein
MLLRYINTEGRQVEIELGPDTLTIGRSPDATVVVQGEKISRFHCGIRPWDTDFILKDYGSTNGTCVNENRVQVAVIKPGDVIRVGDVRIMVDLKSTKGTKTILKELTEEMNEGKKGYRTMLREIVQSTNPAADKNGDTPKPAPASGAEPGGDKSAG